MAEQVPAICHSRSLLAFNRSYRDQCCCQRSRLGPSEPGYLSFAPGRRVEREFYPGPESLHWRAWNLCLCGSEPDLLALSTTSKYLYAGLDGSSSLQRFNLPALTKDINISFGPASFFGPYVAMDLQASPVSDGTVALVLELPGHHLRRKGVYRYMTMRCRGRALYAVLSRPGARRVVEEGCTTRYSGLLLQTRMYLLNNEDTGFDFYTVPVTVSGFGTVTSPRQTGRMA